MNFTGQREALAGRDDRVISLSADTDGVWLTIQICDNGPSSDEKDMPFVFDRFYRAPGLSARDQAGSGLHEGLGLGLSIARELVAAHDGKIDLRCSADGGVLAEKYGFRWVRHAKFDPETFDGLGRSLKFTR